MGENFVRLRPCPLEWNVLVPRKRERSTVTPGSEMVAGGGSAAAAQCRRRSSS